MVILFTKSNKLGSKLIRTVTGEKVSHCALKYGNYVLHSTAEKGVTLEKYSDFLKSREVIYTLRNPEKDRFIDKIYQYYGKKYDYLGFLTLGLRILLRPIFPKVSLWNVSGMFICTELFKKDRLLTPEQLYKELKSERI